MTASKTMNTEALHAIDALQDAADAFIKALENAADQDAPKSYWTAFIAQIKHVTEHGTAALVAPTIVLLDGDGGREAARVRHETLSAAQSAMRTAAKAVLDAQSAFGRSDDRLTPSV